MAPNEVGTKNGSKHPWRNFLKIFTGKSASLSGNFRSKGFSASLYRVHSKNNLRNGVSFYSTDHLNYIFCRALFLSVDYPRLVTENTWKACKVVIQELDNKEETDATVSGDSCEKPSVFLTLLCNPVSTLVFFTG